MRTLFSAKTFRLGIAFACIFIVTSVSMVSAQSLTGKDNKYYMGLGVNFGSRSFKSASNYSEIDQALVSMAGGQLGITWGNKLFRGDVGLIGYYSSVSNIVGSIDLYTNHASVKFYPTNLFCKTRPRLDPYINAGVMYDRYKFYGHYVIQDAGKVNYSAPEPYVGSIKQTSATLGAGLEFRLIDKYDFIHFFSEVKWSRNLKSVNTRNVFENTQLGSNTIINVGLYFGAHR